MERACKNHVRLHSLFHPAFCTQSPLLHVATTKAASALIQQKLFTSPVAVISVCLGVCTRSREGVRVKLCEPVSGRPGGSEPRRRYTWPSRAGMMAWLCPDRSSNEWRWPRPPPTPPPALLLAVKHPQPPTRAFLIRRTTRRLLTLESPSPYLGPSPP